MLFGSCVANKETERSNIDICLVIPHEKGKITKILGIVVSRLSLKKEYDVSVFEELPLYMKAEVIERHIVSFSHNILELYEYFYFYRKLWNDQKHRQQLTKEEILKLFDK